MAVAHSPSSADQTADVALISSSPLHFASQMASYEDPVPCCPPQSSMIGFAELVSSDSSGYGRWGFEATATISGHVEDATSRTMSQYARSSPRLPYMDPSSFVNLSDTEIGDDFLFPQITLKAPKAFRPRKVRDNQFSLNKSYVLCTLRSYPSMMLPGDTLPPFIHPQCLFDISGDDQVHHKSLPGPLATCAAIVQMFSVKNDGNAIFIWKAIRMEQERLLDEVRHLSLK